MCGFVGIALSRDARREIDPARLALARDVLTHRGPDDAGLFTGPRIGLGHRRLSIVDLEGGRQPFASDDEVLRLVYNGEVYNHPALRRQLEARGHRYRTRCDTETVLRLYQEHGSECVRRMRGMFAFAVWDRSRESLFLARDRLGIKPLYYAYLPDGSLCFASEIKALLELDTVRPELNLEALPDYLANHAPSGPETLFRGIRRLPQGHTLRWRDGEIRLERYWEPSFEPLPPGDVGENPPAAFRELFTESVRMRLMADVPLGVFLSGGIDSASITGVMSQLVDEPVKSFSVAFRDPDANELSYARQAAEAFGTDHHEVVVDREDFFDELPRLIWHEDEPLAHPSSVPLHFVARLAREHVKVVLTGEGSDELMGGYGRHWKTLFNMRLGSWWERMTPALGRRAVRSAVEAMPRGSGLRQQAERTFLCRPANVVDLYLENFAVFSRVRQRRLLRPEIREQARIEDAYENHLAVLERAGGWPLLHRILHLDVNTYLQELLMKQDQMSMSASVESRVPFLDHRLVEYAAGLPPEWKIRGRRGKRVLREAMEGVVPDDILTRPKMGFPVPFGRWAREGRRDFVEETILGPRATARGLFEPDAVRRIVEEHREGRVDHSERLWALLNLELWQRAFIDGEDPGRLQARSPVRAAAGRE
jgi:asparagine synthase (glutamine-hydrolysing)